MRTSRFDITSIKTNFMVVDSTVIKFVFMTLSLLFTTGLFLSCKDESESKRKDLNQQELITKVKKLYFNDQKDRRIIGILEYSCDSDTASATQLGFDKEIKLAVDIMYAHLSSNDDINTESLIALTKKYGFPGMDYLNHDVPVFLVFVHSDKKYFKQIRKLISKEFKVGHVSKFERDYIFWHLDGRKGLPPRIPHPINYRTNIAIFEGALKEDGN